MASSSFTVISCIHSALDDVDYLVSRFSYSGLQNDIFVKQRFRLRNLKTFVILRAKLGNDVHLGSLLIRIEDAVSRNSQKIPPEFLDLKALDVHSRAERVESDFQIDFQSLKENIDEWYVSMSDHMRQSNSLASDEIGQIIQSILDSLMDFFCFSKIFLEPMEALREHLNFLKNFCFLVTKRGVKGRQMKDFLAHTEAVAVTAAHICFLCEDDIGDEEWQKGMQLKILTLLLKIMPTDSQVCKLSTEPLSCSKLSRRIDAPTHIQGMEDDFTIVMKNVVDYLISIRWEMLQLDTRHVGYSKNCWQVLYEGLRSLRTFLKEQRPNGIDEKTRDDIGVVVCDAGVLIYSFYPKNGEIELGVQDLWERIEGHVSEVKEKVPQTSTFNPSSINGPGYVDNLLENLMELTNGEIEPIVLSGVLSIKEELLYLRSFLGEIVEFGYELRDLWNRALELAKRVECLIDLLIVGPKQLRKTSRILRLPFLMQFDSVMEDIQNFKTEALKISYGKRRDIKVKEVTSTSTHVPSQNMASITTEVVGFQDEAKSITNRLLRGSKQLRVIAIVGMGGLGKTTLAAKVFNDPAVMLHFQVCAWCPVSQTLDKKTLLLELLNQMNVVKFLNLTEEDLAEKLRKYLKGKRYLIFLDDIWTIEAWNSLNASFPDDSTGSRIMLTSRSHDAAPRAMRDQEPLCLRQFNEFESLELLQRKLFPGKVWPPALHDLGMQIVENCKGLPLTIVIVAGILASTEQEGWKEIVDDLSSGVGGIEQCMDTLELSYKHLPDHLKPCFLYFGAFPEDKEISVRMLIRLWIAEGFIRESKSKSLKDAAEGYLEYLIGRSLIMVAKRRSIGGVKTCRIHDMLRDFCLRKAKDLHFLHLVKGHDELLAFNEPCNLRRLCIHSKPQDLKEAKIFCPRARSVLFFSSTREWNEKEEYSINIFLIHIFKFVRVLDLEPIYLGSGFPSEIQLLVQLRYLAIRGSIKIIPSWVGNLSMLETFIVDPCYVTVQLPDTIWNLCKLKYLYMRIDFLSFNGGMLPIQNLDNSSVLDELDALCGAVFISPGSMENQMSKFVNIRKLKCILIKDWDGTEAFYNIIGVPYFLSRLESLHMIWVGMPLEPIRCELSFPSYLKKLTLKGFGLPWSKISTIGVLPNLEVLKLLRDSFDGETWKMGEGEFRKLRYLKLRSLLQLVRWTASESDGQFPSLEKLVLEYCWQLKEVPSCLGSIPTLEMIEVRYCSKDVATLLKPIEEEQKSLGNSAFKILLTS